MKQYLLLLIAVCVMSCKQKVVIKPNPDQSCASPPPALSFVVVDQDGKSLINSLEDKVIITYEKNKQAQSFSCNVFALRESFTDTTKATQYQGLAINSLDISWASSGPEPIKIFDLSINDQKVGRMFFDLQKVNWTKENGCYEEKGLKLNDHAATVDNEVFPTVSVLRSN